MSAFDSNLGSTTVASTVGGTTVAYNSIAAVAVGGRAVVKVSYFSSSGLTSTMTVGGNSAARDLRVTNGQDYYEEWSVDLPAGLASGSSISTVWSSATGVGGRLVGAVSFTGIDAASPVVTTATSTGLTGASWSSGAASNTAIGDVFSGGAGNEDATNPTTSTATSGTELHDAYIANDGQGFATGYKIAAAVGSDSITGTFSNVNSTKNTGGLVIYKNAVAGSAEVLPLAHDFPQPTFGPF